MPESSRFIKEMQSLADESAGRRGRLPRESVDDDVGALEVNIEGSEVDSIPEKRITKPHEEDFSDISFEELEVPDIDGLDDIDVDSGLEGSSLPDDDLDSLDNDLDFDLGEDEESDEDAEESDDEDLVGQLLRRRLSQEEAPGRV